MRIRIAVHALVAFCFPVVLSAQVTETQVAFDSAGKVRSLTPALVARYELSAPVWPVTGDFSEARLYVVNTGGHILTVERRSGSLERHSMSDDALTALRTSIDAALTRTGAAVTEAQPEVISSPARGAFVRNQMILSWVLYAPLLSSLANDGKTASAIYLLSIGSSYFITTGIGRKLHVTRAQNHLATDGALRGAAASSGVLFAIAGNDPHEDAFAAVALLGAIGGTTAGFMHGRRLTDSEAQAAATISSFASVTTAGLAGTFGLFHDSTSEDQGRAVVGAAVASGVLGYLWGPRYPRTARYAVTKGDVQMLKLGATLGTMVALTPLIEGDPSPEVGFGLATAGFLGGIMLAERTMARGFDHTSSDVMQIWLGTLAGGLMGGAVNVIVEPGASAAFAIVTAGAIGGAVLGHKLTAPRRAGDRTGVLPRTGTQLGKAAIELNPMGFAFGAAGVRGQHALVTVRF